MSNKAKITKILIVAGSAESLMTYQALLSNFATETALTAEEAMDTIDDFEPDVVIIDENLRGLSGIELAKWIRADQAAPHYYGILIIAGKNTANLSQIIEKSGADTACTIDQLRADLSIRVDFILKYKKLYDKSEHILGKLNQSKDNIRMLEERDSITKLYNLHYLSSRLEKEFRHAERIKSPLSLMIVAINNFKDFSHIKGPSFCMKLLEQLADDLLNLTRTDDVVARGWGGEFLILLPDTHLLGVANLKSRVSHHVSEHLYGLDHDRILLEISFGVSTYIAGEGKIRSTGEMLLCAEDDLNRDVFDRAEVLRQKKAT